MSDFDLLVIGGGSAGFASAIAACEFDKRVTIVNSGTIDRRHFHQFRLYTEESTDPRCEVWHQTQLSSV